MNHGHAHGHGHGHGTEFDFAEQAEALDLDGQVFAGYLHEAVDAVRDATAGGAVRRVADLGCGTGTGTMALTERFGDAEVFAVDASEPLLQRVSAVARERGLAGRVHPVQADLDAGWPPQLHGLDVVWASASVHHLADPEAGLAAVRSALAPDGLLALVEVDDVLNFNASFLAGPDDGPGGLERRVRAVLAPDATSQMPYLGADWAAVLARCGFRVEVDRVFDVVLDPPPAGATRYAVLSLRRLRERLHDSGREAELAAADLALLDALAGDGPDGVGHRRDLVACTRRHLWVAWPA